MFVVTKLRHPFLFWTSAEVKAEEDMCLEEQTAGFDHLHAPVLETWTLNVAAGETFALNMPRTTRVGDRLPLEAVASKLPLQHRWRCQMSS